MFIYVAECKYTENIKFISLKIRRVKKVIDEKVFDENDYIRSMADATKEKFEKY